jgi:hypothetical protein
MNPSIAYSPAQCWVNNATANSTQTVYATFAGDSNLETATSNTVTGFKINGDLTLSYSDTSTYGGFATSISPIVAGGSGVKTFGISQHTTGYQVDGITIDTATGVISVLRSTTVGNYRMVASVTDEVSAYSYYNDLYINVLSQQSPTFSLSRTSETVDKDAEVTGFSISHSSTPAILYSISPSLPNGLRFSTHSGVISGAPTVAQSATAYTITAINNAGSETATFTLAVSEQLVATISVSIGTNPAAKGTANTIIATISAAGKVQFFIDGKRVPGCLAVRGTTSATCNWKPSRIGAAIIKATLKPTNGSIPTISSTPLQVSVGRRTGARG